MKQQVFIFNDTTAQQRRDLPRRQGLLAEHILGGGAHLDHRPARRAVPQHHRRRPQDHRRRARRRRPGPARRSGDWSTATDTLRNQEPAYRAQVAEALAFIKPSFNEDMRGGHTNM
jgi:hypothetical protein